MQYGFIEQGCFQHEACSDIAILVESVYYYQHSRLEDFESGQVRLSNSQIFQVSAWIWLQAGLW